MAINKPAEWYKANFMVSTAKNLLQPQAINAAHGSDFMPWTYEMSEEALQRSLDNSLCFGVYLLPQSSAEVAGRSGPRQIGNARLVSDLTTFAYLTDLYILPEFQRQGLGSWLMRCINEELESWPDLRRAVLFTSNEKAMETYCNIFGMFAYGKENPNPREDLFLKKGHRFG